MALFFSSESNVLSCPECHETSMKFEETGTCEVQEDGNVLFRPNGAWIICAKCGARVKWMSPYERIIRGK